MPSYSSTTFLPVRSIGQLTRIRSIPNSEETPSTIHKEVAVKKAHKNPVSLDQNMSISAQLGYVFKLSVDTHGPIRHSLLPSFLFFSPAPDNVWDLTFSYFFFFPQISRALRKKPFISTIKTIKLFLFFF